MTKDFKALLSKWLQRYFPTFHQWLLLKWKFRKANVQHHSNLKLHPTVSIGRFSSIKFGNFPNVKTTTEQSIALGAQVRLRNNVQLSVLSYDQLNIKDYTTVHDNCMILGSVTLEKYNVLSANIYMSSGNHYAHYQPFWLVKDQDQAALQVPEIQQNHSAAIHIEEDCWLGWGVFVKRGVYIGRGAIIGAYTVVTKDVLPYDIQVGSPNKTIKKRLDFSPPSSIFAMEDQHLPYFYRGFGHKRFELEKSRKWSGIFAEQNSLLCLKKIQARTLIIEGQVLTATDSLELFIQFNENQAIKKDLKNVRDFSWTISIAEMTDSTRQDLQISATLQELHHWVLFKINMAKNETFEAQYPILLRRISLE